MTDNGYHVGVAATGVVASIAIVVVGSFAAATPSRAFSNVSSIVVLLYSVVASIHALLVRYKTFKWSVGSLTEFLDLASALAIASMGWSTTALLADTINGKVVAALTFSVALPSALTFAVVGLFAMANDKLGDKGVESDTPVETATASAAAGGGLAFKLESKVRYDPFLDAGELKFTI